VRAGYPPEDALSEADLAAAAWGLGQQPPGRARLGHAARDRVAVSCRCARARGPVGLLGVARDPPNALLTPDERRLLDALGDQAGVAIERISLAAEIDQTRMLRETERLRSALLTSISHDLRTPLASVLGALTSLRSFNQQYDAGDARGAAGDGRRRRPSGSTASSAICSTSPDWNRVRSR